MIRYVIAFVVGGLATSAAWQGYEIKRDYDLVTREWQNVVRVDRLRGASIHALLAAMKRSQSQQSDIALAIQGDLNELAQRSGDGVVSLPAKFDLYDRARKRLSADLKELTTAVYVDRAFLANAQLIPVVSQIEGTESAAIRAENDYNLVADRYMRVKSGPADLIAHHVLRLPEHVGLFEAFGEAGPVQSGADSDDDD